jgi:hypothetical protein
MGIIGSGKETDVMVLKKLYLLFFFHNSCITSQKLGKYLILNIDSIVGRFYFYNENKNE